MIVHRPPATWNALVGVPTVFLAGSIDMGAAQDWQSELANALAPRRLTILNPRRPDWDSTWRQTIDEPNFREQVEWELDGLERADLVAMWFAPDSVAPVTLLELGLTARAGKLVVGCPDGYWRKGNVEIVCARFGIPLATAWVAFAALVRARLDERTSQP